METKPLKYEQMFIFAPRRDGKPVSSSLSVN
jgi:hypothetical protein